MITPYRGRVVISCTVDLCKEDRARHDVNLSCLACALHTTEVLSLDEKPITTIHVSIDGKEIGKAVAKEIAVKPAYESRVSDKKVEVKEV